MAEITAPAGWRLLAPTRVYRGFAYGLRYPSIVESVAVRAVRAGQRTAILTAVLDALAPADLPELPFADGAADGPDDGDDPLAGLGWYMRLADHLNALAKLPIVDTTRCVGRSRAAATYAVPCLVGGLEAMAALLAAVRTAIAEGGAGDGWQRDALAHFRQLRAANLSTSNGPRLLRAAIAADIAVQELPGNIVQYGLGKNAAMMECTFTEHTSVLGTRAARDKSVTSNLLRRLRLPVALHGVAGDVETAVRIAARIGYPVVVKPIDCDGGKGVQADLQDEAELRKAFAAAAAFSRLAMIEKHVAGRDYRLTVFRGRVIWAVERRPAGVVGDGLSSIAELVATANADPARGEGAHARLKRLKLDGEALDLLVRGGMTAGSIPAAGRFVRLRRASNVSSGGTPIVVYDQVDPENALLAVRAAEALKLDLAGVDLIMPDIARPWQQGGAIVCEVNAQPELGGTTSLHIYPQLLKSLLGGDGSIPVIGFLGAARADRLARQVAAALRRAGVCAGLHVRGGAGVAGKWLERGAIACLPAGQALVADRSVEALLLGVLDDGVQRSGLPVPRIDLLVVSGELPVAADGGAALGAEQAAALLRLLVPCCRAVVAVADGADGTNWAVPVMDALDRRIEVVSTRELGALVQDLFGKTQATAQG